MDIKKEIKQKNDSRAVTGTATYAGRIWTD